MGGEVAVGDEGGEGAGGVGMHWQPLNILIFRKCKQSIRERWSGGRNSRGGTVGGEGAGARWAWACIALKYTLGEARKQ